MENVKRLAAMGLGNESRMLVFMPHPDDEAVFASGLIHKAVGQGIPVRIVTVTRGGKSTLRHGLGPEEDLPAIRHGELVRAFARLGVSDFRILDYPDGGLDGVEHSLRRILSGEIRSFLPTHVITLEPDGIYGHPDHIALSRYVTKAVHLPVRLLYATVTPAYIFPTARNMAKKQVIKPMIPQYRLILGAGDIAAKLRALRAHRTQFDIRLFHLEPFRRFAGNDMLTHEYYAYAG